MMRTSVAIWVLSVVVVAGCFVPSGRRLATLPVSVEGGIVRLGDTLPLKPGPNLGGADVSLTITNTTTQATVSRFIASANVAATVIRVDPADLPGLDPKGADLQTFTLRLQQGGTSTEAVVTVLFDETARMPPSVPLGKAPIIGTDWTLDTEDLAASVVAAWEGTVRCTSSQVVNEADVTLHPSVRERIPVGTPLREFTVQGEFPRRVVQEPWTPPGIERAVMTPRVLRFVIAETAPSRLLTLQAIEDSDVVQEVCR